MIFVKPFSPGLCEGLEGGREGEGNGFVGERGGYREERKEKGGVCVNGEGGGKGRGYAGYSSLGARLCPAPGFMVMSFAWTPVVLL